MQPSAFDRMKNTLFRSKSDAATETPAKGRRLSQLLSPTRSNKGSAKSESPSAPTTDLAATPLTIGQHASPSSDVQLVDESNLDASLGGAVDDPRIAHVDHRSQSITSRVADTGADVPPFLDDSTILQRRNFDPDSSFLPDPSSFIDSQTSRRSSARHYRPRASAYPSGTYSALLTYDRPPLGSSYLSRGNALGNSVRNTDLLGGTRPNAVQRLPSNQRTRSSAMRYTFPDEDVVDYSDGSFSDANWRGSLSSPSAAAARRNKLRAASGRSALYDNKLTDKGQEVFRSDVGNGLKVLDEIRSRSKSNGNHNQETRAKAEQRRSEDLAASKSSDNNDAPVETKAVESSDGLKHPEVEMNLESEQISLPLAAQGNEHSEEVDTKTPASLSTLRAGNELARLPSLKSMVSTISAHTNVSSNQHPSQKLQLDPPDSNIDEEEEVQTPKGNAPIETPSTRGGLQQLPTDTVLAQHVQNVHVPDTIARNHRDVHSSQSGSSTLNVPIRQLNRNNDTLTLKEQNSRIDRLSKENFDLKLKIYFLDKARQDRSEEGVADLQAKNAQLSADLIKYKKDNQNLRKRLRETEKSSGRLGGNLADIQKKYGTNSRSLKDHLHEHDSADDEMTYLQDRVQQLELENGQLQEESMTKEIEKRRMAESLQKMTGAGLGENMSQPSLDNWREALDEEIARRKRAELEVEELYQEIARLKSDRSPVRSTYLDPETNQHSNNVRPGSRRSEMSRDPTSLSGSTLVDQLKQENAELRRDLGAQTSMLTSRNRERERLRQEIEDLKLLHRRGETLGSVTGDSILDRSVSRANNRSILGARRDPISESDLDEYEIIQGNLRDENAALKMRCQDLQRDLNAIASDIEHVETLKVDRDEALHLLGEERDFAAETIERLEIAMEQKDQDIHNLLADLRIREDETNALQIEVQEISEGLERVAGDCENSQAAIQELHNSLTNANGEIESLEQSLRDEATAKERLEVEAESNHNEICFLREEQEGDKIKIGDLEAALKSAHASSREEQDRLREFQELDAEARKARHDIRKLQKALNEQQNETNLTRKNLRDFEQGMREAFGRFDGHRNHLLKRATQMQGELDKAIEDLDQAKHDISEKDKIIANHQALSERRALDVQRLASQLTKERSKDGEEIQQARVGSSDSARISELQEARNEDHRRLHALDDLYTAQVHQRNARLFECWVRISGLCGQDWIKQHFGSGEDVPSLDSITLDASSLDEPLRMAIQSLEATLLTFRTRIRSTEKDIYKDFQALEMSLETRTKRLSELEAAVSQHVPISASTRPSEELARAEHENKLLKRELHILKQGAFALPGLPPPRDELDRAVTAVAAIEREREGRRHPNVPGIPPPLVQAATGVRASFRQDNVPDATSVHHSRRGRSATEHSQNVNEDQDHNYTPIDPTLDGGSGTSVSHTQRAEPDSRTRHSRNPERSLSTTHARPASLTNTTINSNPHSIDPSEYPLPSKDHPTLALSEQKWILRMQDLKRRLHEEREARLLDRDGARKRLEAQEGEVKLLKDMVERERDRGRARRAAEKAKRGGDDEQEEEKHET